MSKHSPAPWIYDPSDEHIYSSIGLPVVYETGTNGSDINLICAAPELLDALIDLLSVFEYYKEPEKVAAVEKAKAAIEKARGPNHA